MDFPDFGTPIIPTDFGGDVHKEGKSEPVVEEVKEIKESGFDTPKNKILKQYGGLESNIPINSPYWKL